MANKNLRDKRILDVLKLTLESFPMTCEDIFRELCSRSKKNGVKSIKALGKILQRFPLMKQKKVVIAKDLMGVEICHYVTVYKLDPDYLNIIPKEFFK